MELRLNNNSNDCVVLLKLMTENVLDLGVFHVHHDDLYLRAVDVDCIE